MLPIAFVAALILCSQGAIQNFHPYATVKTLEGATQTIPQGPVASQEAIKMLGTNGGGFFNANSSHPYENPTPLSDFLQVLLIFLVPAGLTYTFGRMVGDTRQGWALFAAMAVMFLAVFSFVTTTNRRAIPSSRNSGIETNFHQQAAWRQHGRKGNTLRHPRFGVICDCDYRCKLRRHQQRS